MDKKVETKVDKISSDRPTHLLCDFDAFIIKSSKLIRKTYLDDFHDIINILKDEMAIVG